MRAARAARATWTAQPALRQDYRPNVERVISQIASRGGRRLKLRYRGTAHSNARACYHFTRRYPRGECAGCRRIIAVKKRHCRLCWLQGGITASGRRRSPPADFRPGSDKQAMNRISHVGPRPEQLRFPSRRPPPARCSCSRRPVTWGT